MTKYLSEINVKSSATRGDIIEIGIEVLKFRNSSLNLRCEVRNKMTRKTVITVENIVMVSLGEDGRPVAHGKTRVEFVKDRLANS